ncbi:hypothetical protein HPB50_020764 [Hyalomma asiaticum]|uniref:Uncharacterized protein n=1 Tax=Hyalomma asiaticum TaxID=266040 RepID=A0ACB7RKW8_HYAAI|nr:hypothetical protein HPB50_020764 [Hyalomma asiaticum]
MALPFSRVPFRVACDGGHHHIRRCPGRPAKVGGLSADTVAAKDEAKAAFALLGNIPGVLACVNGTLVAIRKPQGLGIGDTASILSRKGYYTLNVMVDSGDWTLEELCRGVPPAEQSGDEQALEP